MIAVRDDTHFDVDLLPTPRTTAGQGWARLVVHIAMAIFAAAFIWYGKQFVDEGLMQTSAIFELQMVVIYAAWPLTGVLRALFLIEKIAVDLAKIVVIEMRRGAEVDGRWDEGSVGEVGVRSCRSRW